MKDYLKESLSDDEEKYLYGIMKKIIFKYQKCLSKQLENETISIDDELLGNLLEINDTYNFGNDLSETKILRDVSALKPYTMEEQERIVETLDNVAKESGLSVFITPLTFNEKLVVFLLYLEKYQVNQVAKLLSVDRRTICNRDKKIKNKFNKAKEDFKNDR